MLRYNKEELEAVLYLIDLLASPRASESLMCLDIGTREGCSDPKQKLAVELVRAECKKAPEKGLVSAARAVINSFKEKSRSARGM